MKFWWQKLFIYLLREIIGHCMFVSCPRGTVSDMSMGEDWITDPDRHDWMTTLGIGSKQKLRQYIHVNQKEHST